MRSPRVIVLASLLLATVTSALLVACGGPIEENADVIQTVFERVCSYSKVKPVGAFIIPLCTTPDKLGAEAEGITKKLADGITA